MSKEEKIVPFTPPSEFAAEEAKLAELKLSTDITDQLTAILMEPHTGKSFTEENDCTGLWYAFARPKALAIMKRFNVTDKSSSL